MAENDITRIAGNIGAMNALNALSNINKQLAIHQSRLSTGKRINSAADDPAGLTIATKMFTRSEGLKTALSNIGDTKNLLAVAESGLGRINDILTQMRNKAESAASDTMGADERTAIKDQLTAYAAQIDDIAKQTKWNGGNLIDGTYATTDLTFQTGADASDFTAVSGLGNMSASANGKAGDLALATVSGSSSVSSTDPLSLFADPAVSGLSTNANLTELASGNYSVKLVMDAAGTTGVVHLYDAGGNEQLIAQGGGTVAKGKAVDTAGGIPVDFGNGLGVVIAAGKANSSTTTAQVTYTRGGTYDVKTSGATGSALVTASDYRSLMSYLDTKMGVVSSNLSKIGAMTGRLTFKEDQVSASQINVEASYNRIMNANMAEEQVNSAKFQILQQTSTAMLAQANSAPQFLLSLFR
jgi:flagellin